MKIEATLYPKGAPGRVVAEGMTVTQVALDSVTGKLTADHGGSSWEVLPTRTGLSVTCHMHMPSAREMLNLAYLDYFNNYLTVETYADHHGLSTEHARAFLELAKLVHETPHPES